MPKALPRYRVKVSPRGRSVRLRVTPEHGLEVAIPKGYDAARIPALLERKRRWVTAALQRANSHRRFVESRPKWEMPDEIRLPALRASWQVAARESGVPFVAIRAVRSSQLVAFGAVNDEAACRAALARWLMRQTRTVLVPRLLVVSRGVGLRFGRVVVKRQKTRWASCSRHATVSLNAKLLFLPPDLVDYVMTHELCHSVEMNHGKRFRALLSHHWPSYRVDDARLSEMWKVVPRWAS